MKKVLGFFMALLIVLMPILADAKTTTTTKKKEPVNVYIFYRTSCGFCQSLHEYMAELESDKSINYMFNVVDYEVGADENNNALMVKVGQYFDVEVDGVPFYVIGDKYFTGYSESTHNDQIVKAIKDAYEDKKYEDIVAGVSEGTLAIPDSDKNTNTSATSKDNDNAAYIILGITAIIVIAVIFGRANTSYYDDEAELEVKEETTIEPVKKKETSKSNTAAKKTTNKSTTTKKNTKTTKKKKI